MADENSQQYTEISYSMVHDESPERVLCPATPDQSSQESPRQIAKRTRRSLDDIVNERVDFALSKRFKTSDLHDFEEFLHNKERDGAILQLQNREKEQEEKIYQLEKREKEQDQKIYQLEKREKEQDQKIRILEDQILELQAIIAAKDVKFKEVLYGCRTNISVFSENIEKLF